MTDGAENTPEPTDALAIGPRRITRRRDFLAAAGGKRFHTERMSVQLRLRAPDEYRDGAPADGFFVGFTITKRVGHAPERNRIRRRLRHALDVAARGVPGRPVDLVVIGRRPILAANFETLTDDLRRALVVAGKVGPSRPRGEARPVAARCGKPAGASAARPTGRAEVDMQPITPRGTIDG